MKSEIREDYAANPFSTGGGGSTFELKVQSSLLAMLLVRGQVPAFENTLICELHLQTEHLGYATDDALVITSDSSGRRRRQLWTIKHGVRFTESNKDFQKVIADAWADFSDSGRFDCEHDALILATSPLVAADYKHLLTLLEFARAALTAEDFLTRVSRVGFASQKSRNYLATIKKLCEIAAAKRITPNHLWLFVRRLYVLTYDFDQTGSQDEARFKTLLAASLRKESGKTGDELWNAIFKWVADRDPRAGSFTRETLPMEWQQLSISIAPHYESGAFHRLLEHSKDLRTRIRTSLGPELCLGRQELIEQLVAAFVTEQFTLVVGQAGAGKSAAALMALEKTLDGAPLFILQATEFARDHLDHALAELRVTESLSSLSALFALHRRKFMLIESVDRLLESMQREAFFMLLARLAEDTTWRVVLTCRHLAVSLVDDAFLKPLGLHSAEIVVPILDETELDYVIERVPSLRPITSNPRTRRLLQNPWFLDKACSVDWTDERNAERLDQRLLRDVLWNKVIVREDVQAAGIHRERERCFRNIALRRARSLQSFVSLEPGEETAVQSLSADELLVEEPHTRRVAPAHDVLEDWALVRWVSETFRDYGQEVNRFFETLGLELPIRRSYRQWLQEALLTEDSDRMRLFVDAVYTDRNVASYWRDETLCSILLSEEAAHFIESHEVSLLAEGKVQLQRVIHLLRIACKKPNTSLGSGEASLGMVFGDAYLVPEGQAWSAVIRLIHRNLDNFGTEEVKLVLGLLEDWTVGINWQSSTPDAAREVGLIALHYWNLFNQGRSEEEILERLAFLLLAAPQAIAEEFKILLNSDSECGSSNRKIEILAKKLLASFDGWSACRFLPGLVVNFAERRWGINCPLPERERKYGMPHFGMESHFGLPAGLGRQYYPASALQGPFLPLLRTNSGIGIDLILKLVNFATERFVNSGLDQEYGQRPFEVKVDFGERVTCKQWANPRLWMMYREGMPAPNLVASALMVLEEWLLKLAEAGHNLRNLSRTLILNSKGVSITAVVASVAMAYPDNVGDTVLALTRTPEFFNLDLHRYVQDGHSTNTLLGELGFHGMKRIYNQERQDSDKFSHRRRSLETLTCTLQTGSLRDQVWQIIDNHKAQLPPPEEQTEAHKIWRLRLHRIDLRNFSPKEELENGRVLFEPGPPDPDVAEVIENQAPSLKATEETISLLAWGMEVFEHSNSNKADPGHWREMLNKARLFAEEHQDRQTEVFLLGDGPGYVAAVCIRDHWGELNSEERTWCREFMLTRVTAEKDTGSETKRVQRFSIADSRTAARVLPLLLADADEITRKRVREAIAAALTHAVEEIREYAAFAVGQYLWERDENLASACIAGLLDFVRLKRRCYSEWSRQPSDSNREFLEIVSEHIDNVRMRIVSAEPLTERSHYRLSVSDPFSAEVLPLIISIISKQQERPLAEKLLKQIAVSLVHVWDRERRPNSWRNYSGYYRQERDYQKEIRIETLYADFAVQCPARLACDLWEPFVSAIPVHADEVADVFKQLIYAEDAAHRGTAFWVIWSKTKDAILSLPNYLDSLSSDRSHLTKLCSVLMLDNIYWKEDAKDWKPLHGYENELHMLFKATGTAPPICKSFIRLLDSVGSSLLPKALLWLDDRLAHGTASEMIGDKNSLFSLARILMPLVFSKTDVLRKSQLLRDAAIRILDAMVEQGSSAAFRMRDFLVTPVAPNALSNLG